MSAPALSIIVPNHNYGRYLPRLAASLAGQQGGLDAVELILVDDGSTDDSRQEAAALKALPLAGFSALWLDHCGHPGPVRNAGFARAQGGLILCLDPDDIPGPGYLAACLNALAERPDAHLAYTDYTHIEDGHARDIPLPDFDPGLLRVQNILPPAAVIRRKVWEASVGYRANTAYEDWDFWVQAAVNGFGFARVPGPRFGHPMHGANLSYAARKNDARAKAAIVLNNALFFPAGVRHWADAVMTGQSWADPGPRGIIPTLDVVRSMLARSDTDRG
ncbi:MAG: glycosyltransferase family 2 protein [Pseudodesulfovibrio sp.]|uniref:Glycosyl transferase family 2 n=1 Tax=Pseudodesulfovibrio aespoeensis (strain ATCC 700646 / DSM 10631 / Aspo-2) TaxID=643562 RepID=E6VTW5_PSEA9|nr:MULTISPECIES: glycosyltransferase family A protein [Pseudodesulfovibrio]MBU4190973.1 glycosyltransferase family 2 protein [Pseudomonadota bacterium]ADU61057.1 glycosyl transferase family 2 [Pseudodesulfovibrio aespoeensis Aspo-2]MBU4245028.1 glycosyltransferase family 2 protein [Pseudomonadota bacterium]MBU4380435.1 glycosyltransferase family 2 protein [Pseudomonadota bacterium]MBU4476407.1 glycosyltransferase family 2 protein [Pseudomonadota bacterium]